ncbi:hypothetical protein K438DRAFT_1724176 [Mycena galopus ATCC 62051]|nr:hypothetical protein K438DRAFT_1724176 [Mycena galopus ATCC 62051]
MPRPGFGIEGFMGIGGGTVSGESEANLKRGQELLNMKKPQEALPFLLKALEDPNNLDACSSISMMLPQDTAIAYLQKAELAGRRHLQNVLGPDCFELTCRYGAPNFWGILETRPYMRLLGTLVRTYVNAKRWSDAVSTNIEILRICHSDNMGQRAWMSALLLQAGRPADALYFAQRWLEADETPPGSGIDFAPPQRAPMTDAQIKKVEKWVDLQMIYSAALAAFILDGDSTLARQYLHIAVKYPSVLIKVIGKFKERVDVDTHATRSSNGAEDARDHLWLAQDLWMKDAAWNWVAQDPIVMDHVLRNCPQCNRKEERVGQWQKCAGCKQEWYCSRGCQKAQWPAHKDACKKTQHLARMSAMWS